jgi:acyl carrier protein
MVNSMGMLRLVAFIDDTWDIRVPPEDFTIENFRTIAAIDAYLRARLDDSDGR